MVNDIYGGFFSHHDNYICRQLISLYSRGIIIVYFKNSEGVFLAETDVRALIISSPRRRRPRRISCHNMIIYIHVRIVTELSLETRKTFWTRTRVYVRGEGTGPIAITRDLRS